MSFIHSVIKLSMFQAHFFQETIPYIATFTLSTCFITTQQLTRYEGANKNINHKGYAAGKLSQRDAFRSSYSISYPDYQKMSSHLRNTYLL